jgi:glycosyltransferase involved in cell wall biosynthesis
LWSSRREKRQIRPTTVLFPPVGVADFMESPKEGKKGEEEEEEEEEPRHHDFVPDTLVAVTRKAAAAAASAAAASASAAASATTSAQKQKTQKISSKKVRYIISVGQFRPEKDHALQLRAFKTCISIRAKNKKMITMVMSKNKKKKKRGRSGGGKRDGEEDDEVEDEDVEEEVRLVLLGSCRDAGDEARVAVLKNMAADLGIDHLVDFALNLPFKGEKGAKLKRKEVDGDGKCM